MKTKTITQDKPYAVEYYYKTQWGRADEFLRLYKKNHLPLLRKRIEIGHILKITMVKPRLHATEDARWDFRATIVWKNIQVTNEGFSERDLARKMFPDQDTYEREEQRRFEILVAHWDVPVVEVDLDK